MESIDKKARYLPPAMTAVPLSFDLVRRLSRTDRSSTAVYLVNARLVAYPEVWYRIERHKASEADVMPAVVQETSRICNIPMAEVRCRVQDLRLLVFGCFRTAR